MSPIPKYNIWESSASTQSIISGRWKALMSLYRFKQRALNFPHAVIWSKSMEAEGKASEDTLGKML